MKYLRIPNFIPIKDYQYWVSEMNILSHYECELIHDSGLANPLEEFIYSWEPAGDEDSNKFRQQLLELVNFLVNIPKE